MRRYILTAVLAALLITPVFAADYPPAGWTDSITEAISRAEKEDKMILMDFSGSDWCGWCKKLEKEIFQTREFQAWAEKNLVRVFIDFPRNRKQSDDVVKQNQVLQEFFGVKGFPTVFLLDSSLTPLLQTGYTKGGPSAFIEVLEKERNLQVKSPEEFRKMFLEVVEEYIGPVPKP